jgi:peptidoglycan-associated lipoprotein
MHFAGAVGRAGRLFGVLAVVILLAACARHAQPQNYGEGGPATPGSPGDFVQNVGDTVHFLTDSPALTPEAQNILVNQARWLNHYPQYSITIEGNADERGTREYNLALGSKRAVAVRNFLITQGVNGARIRTISYGKERPIAICDNITCWSQNRRARTVLNVRNMAER